MHRLLPSHSKSAYLTATAAGLWASSTILQTRTTAAPAADPLAPPRAAKKKTKRNTSKGKASAGGKENASPFPTRTGTGPMVAVYLDQPSVEKLKAQYQEARDGQLRKVVLQYGASASERELYRHLFSGRAEVKVTGDASSSGRRALVVSVSHAGEEVSPMSLSAAIDISPKLEVDDSVVMGVDDGPGPLASTVLIQQIKQSGATKKDMWEGMLSPLLAHGRQFPREVGAYVRLQEPISVGGTICRADWVDGASTRCRDTTSSGKKRKEDWKASTCSVCKHFEASPCGDIFRRFVDASRRRDEEAKDANIREDEAQKKGPGEEDVAETQRSTEDQEKAVNAERAGKPGKTGNGSKSVVATGKENAREVSKKIGGSNRGRAKNTKKNTKGGGGSSGGKDNGEAAGEKKGKRRLKPEAIFQELRECSIFHDV